MILATKIGHPSMVAFTRFFECVMRMLRREAEQTEHDAEALMAFSLEHGLLDWLNWSKAIFGWALEERGERRGLDQIAETIASSLAGRGELMLPLFYITLAEVNLRRDQPTAARTAIEGCLLIAGRNGEVVYAAELHRLYGESLLREPGDAGKREQAAERSYLKSIDIARTQGAKWWELRATLSLARLWTTQGRTQAARERVAALYDWFTEGFDTPDLKAAKLFLDQHS